jgi:hypothetical protein
VAKTDCALVDCLTLWISNLLIRHDDKYAREKVEELIEKLPQLNFHLVFVTNEVGSGIVPDNPLARKFRDLAGWTNQRMAQAANEVILMVAGVPIIAKKKLDAPRKDLERIRPLDRSIEMEAEETRFSDKAARKSGQTGSPSTPRRRDSGKSSAAPWAKTVICLRSGPRDYRGRRQRVSQRCHGANDLQFCAAAPPSAF